MYTERRLNYLESFNIQHDRRYYSAGFKAEVALAAIKNEKSTAELAKNFLVHPHQIELWKNYLLNNLSLVFENAENNTKNPIKYNHNPHAKIGQIMAENDFLTKVLGR